MSAAPGCDILLDPAKMNVGLGLGAVYLSSYAGHHLGHVLHVLSHDGRARDRAKSQTIPSFYLKIGFRIDSIFLTYCQHIMFCLLFALIQCFWQGSDY